MEIKITRRGRYKGHKGKFWDAFACYVCVRDFAEWGKCISCGKNVSSYKDLQAGHYMAAGNSGFSLLFDERNVNGECPYCNAFDGNHQVGYREGLDERFGPGTAEGLEERYKDNHFRGKTTKEWSKKEYEAKTNYYTELLTKYKEM